MRNPIRIVFLLLALVAANTALAQAIVYTVEGWGIKAGANSYQGGVGVTPPPGASGAAGVAPGKANLYDSVLTIPMGDPAVNFSKSAAKGEHLRSVLVEFPQKGGNPSGPAPFAIRLTEVSVMSVMMSKAGDDRAGIAEVRLRASKIEWFSAQQDRTGKLVPGAKAGFDTKTMSAF